MPSEPAPQQPQRLHPASILFGLGSAARSLVLPGIFLLFASRGSGYEPWLMIVFVPTAIGVLIKYWNYTYRFDVDEIVIREGLLRRNERHIPYARVQNIDLSQNLLHRLFSVAEVRLETASGGSPEAVMRVLSLNALKQLRAQVFRGDRQPVVPGEDRGSAGAADTAAVDGPAERSLLVLPARELALFGLISSRGTAVIAAAMGLIWQFYPQRFDEQELDGLRKAVVQVKEALPLPGPAGTAVLGLLGILGLLLTLRLLAAVWAVVKFHGFRLRRRGDGVTTEYGLLTRIAATIPRQRIQLISIRSGWLHRLFGRATVQCETAGGGSEPAAGGTLNRLWLAPLIREEQIRELVDGVLPEASFRDVEWRKLAPGAARRILRRSIIVVILATFFAAFPLGLWCLLLPLVGLPWAILHSRMYVEHAAYGLTPSAVVYRSGWWIRRASAVRFNKIQTLIVGESPFDRRHRMASVRVDTAGAGKVGHQVAIRYLDAATARSLVQRLALEAGRTEFLW